MLRTTGIYFIILVMILVKCFLPDEKPEIIPFPLQSVSDKGDFTFNKATLISVENGKTGYDRSGVDRSVHAFRRIHPGNKNTRQTSQYHIPHRQRTSGRTL